MNFNYNEFNSLIRHRRSIFPNMYTNEVVEDAIIIQILENANWAPTHKLTCPWRFCVFTGDGLKKLAAFQSNLYKEISTQNGSYKEKTFETCTNYWNYGSGRFLFGRIAIE